MAALKPFAMPKWGIEMTEGTIAEWMVQEGEVFAKGTVLALIETDKITNEVEAEAPGVLVRIVAGTGKPIPVGALLAVMGNELAKSEEIDAFLGTFKPGGAIGSAGAPASDKGEECGADAAPAAPPPIMAGPNISPAARQLAEERGIDPKDIVGSGKGGRLTHQDVDQASRPPAARIGGQGAVTTAPDTTLDGFYASPLAKRLAIQHGVDLGGLVGSGPRGRISKTDVLAHVRLPASDLQPSTASPEIVPMGKVRAVVARRLTEAKQTIPHFYLRNTATIDALLELRRHAASILGTKASINDFLIRAVALALVEVPDCNVQVHGDAIHRFSYPDVALAVTTDKGLMTPIVRKADLLMPHEIAGVTQALIAKAKAGRLSFDDIEGGSFTISNLGMFGIDSFDAIINPPQGAILAVGRAQRVWAEQTNGSAKFETQIHFTLSCDHRAIDGAAGAAFLTALKRLIESPDRLFERSTGQAVA